MNLESEAMWLAPLRRHFALYSPCPGAEGSVTVCEVGSLHVLQVSAGALRLELIKKESSEASLAAVLQRVGVSELRQAGRRVSLSSGQMGLLSAQRPFEVEFNGDGRQTWLLLPAAALRAVFPYIEELTAAALPCPPTQIKMLSCLADLLQELPAVGFNKAGHQHAAAAVAELLASAMTAGAAAEAIAQPNLASYHVARIKRFMLSNLNDNELTVSKASLALNISPSHIHRLFVSERQTFSEWLWDQRLLACKAALASAANAHLAVSQIAFKFGYSNPSHFSRAFKAKFGMPPTACRERDRGRRG